MNRSIAREVAHIYEQRRLQAEQDRDRTIKRIYENHPDLEMIDQSLQTAGMEMVKETLAHGDAKKARQVISRLKDRRSAYIEQHAIPGDFDQVHYVCPLCQDTGQYKGASCRCYQSLLVPLLTKEANMKHLAHMRFDTFDAELFSDHPDPEHYQSRLSPRRQALGLRKVAERFTTHFDQPDVRNLLFVGKPGTGKTFLMACIGHALLEQGYSVLYLSAPSLFDSLQEHRILLSSYNPDPVRLDHSTAMRESIMNCDLLMIDDLGTEAGAATKYADLLGVIDTRQGTGRKMIISSNADPATLRDHYDERLLSRLMGGFSVYRFFGEDVRLQLNRKRRHLPD